MSTSRNCYQTAEYLLLMMNNNIFQEDVTPITIELVDNDGAFVLDNDGTQIILS